MRQCEGGWGEAAVAVLGVLACVVICVLVAFAISLAAGHSSSLDQAEREGVEAGRAGVPVEACPYSGGYSDGQRQRWMKAWAGEFVKRKGGDPGSNRSPLP